MQRNVVDLGGGLDEITRQAKGACLGRKWGGRIVWIGGPRELAAKMGGRPPTAWCVDPIKAVSPPCRRASASGMIAVCAPVVRWNRGHGKGTGL